MDQIKQQKLCLMVFGLKKNWQRISEEHLHQKYLFVS